MRIFKKNPKENSYRPAAARYRLKRRSTNILRDTVTVFLSLTAIAAVTSLLIYGYSFLVSLPYLQAKEITIRGCKELTEKDILGLAAIRPTQNILVINVEEAKRRIKVNPWVKEVSIGREFPDRVVIEIRERTPVALLKKEAAFYLMDINGITFKRLESGDEMDLPILTGFHSGDKTDQKLLGKSLDMLNYLTKKQNFPNIKTVSEIHGNERHGISLYTNTGLCLLLGFDNYENKLNNLPVVMADLEQRRQKTGFLQIDLSDPVKITVQQRNISAPAEPTPSKGRYKT